MVTSGSLPRRLSVHPVLAVLAVLGGLLAMLTGVGAMARLGLRLALVTGELALVAPGLILAALARVSLREGLGLVPVRRRTLVLAVLGGAALWAASLGLMNVQFVIWRPPEAFLDSFKLLHQRLRPDNVYEGLLSVTAIALMPAVCEETLFRGIVLPSLMRAGALAGLLGSAALFALIHIDAVGSTPVFYRLPFAFAVGLGLAALRLATGSLLPSTVAHATLNTITFGTVFLTGAASDAVDEPQALMGALLLVFGLAATAVVLRALRR